MNLYPSSIDVRVAEDEFGEGRYEKTTKFTARQYQTELYEYSVEKNSILVLGTGSGKTFISILLIKKLNASIIGKLSESINVKRTVFIVNTVPLVYQQADAIARHTPFSVGKYEGSMDVDNWDDGKWKKEFDENEVLVFTAQIFDNLIKEYRLPLKRVNLLIMDECHHATGNHPMREIMNEYSKLLKSDNHDQVPRLLGLTACIVHGSCKPAEFVNKMRALETTMHCSLVTSKYQNLVREHSTRPEEMIIEYNNELPQCYEKVKKSIDDIELVMNNLIKQAFSGRGNDRKKDKMQKFIHKILTGIVHAMKTLGNFTCVNAIKLEIEYLKGAECDSFEEKDIFNNLEKHLSKISSDHENEKLMEDPSLHISSKVKRLIEFLGAYSEKTDCKKILIFVERRNTAKLLHSLLIEFKELDADLQWLLPESLVGGTTNYKDDLKVNIDLLKQKLVLDKFRTDECNVIVSTSVLEEGVDVRSCNCVIRFDFPSNYRSYVQSIGRARAVPSKFVIFADVQEVDSFCKQISLFRCISKELVKLCHDRPLPSEEDVINSFKDFELEPPFAPFGIHGPQVTFNSAIPLLYKYCGSLPHDKFTDLSPSFEYLKAPNGNVITRITLPKNASFRDPVLGNPWQNQEDAKKSAALKLCKVLHDKKELNDHLLPIKLKINFDLHKNLKVELENIDPNNMLQLGSKKRKQIYDRKVSSPFKYLAPNDGHFLHVIELQTTSLLISKSSQKVGILLAEEMNPCIFRLYCQNLHEVDVAVNFVESYSFSTEKLKMLELFHKSSYELILMLVGDILCFSREFSSHSMLIVPLNQNHKIDDQLLKSMSEGKLSYFPPSAGKARICKEGVYCGDYTDAIVCPIYRDSKYFIVEKVTSETPLSKFPENKKWFTSYKDYLKKEYNLDVLNNDQSLLQCRDLSKEVNKIPIKPFARQSKSNEDKHPKFLPELCEVLPIKASFYYQLALLPSIMHRLNALALEKELYENVGHLATSIEEENFSKMEFQYHRYHDMIKCKQRHLSCDLRQQSGMSIHPGMILQALSPIGSFDNFNLERLEILGDSFLKFMTSIHLFFKETDNHEGKLTIERSHMVCNSTLYKLAEKKNLSSYIQGFKLERFNVIPYGFYIPRHLENNLLEKNIDPQNWLNYLKKPLTDFENHKICYNPWNEQSISDKCIADCCEALIGAYLLCGGEAAAKAFMIWLGYDFLIKNYSLPTSALLHSNFKNVETEIHHCSRTFRIHQIEQILNYTFHEKTFLIQALTHASDKGNMLTDCYQRLEFLGDAVLDYLVTGHIFAKYLELSPGQLTDMRSFLVNNETLAKAAVDLGLHKYIQHMSMKLSTTIDKFIMLLDNKEEFFNSEDDTLEIEYVEVPKVLGDVIEAIIGAVYIDSNESLEVTWNVIELLLKKPLSIEKIPIDCVREVFEAFPFPKPKFEYQVITEGTLSKCILTVPGHDPIVGAGKNKRVAKQAAAKSLLNVMKRENVSLIKE